MADRSRQVLALVLGLVLAGCGSEEQTSAPPDGGLTEVVDRDLHAG